MSRPLRIEYPDAWYHVMNRGRRKESIFTDADDYLSMLKLLEESTIMWGVRIAAFCLMSNHYHMLLQTPGGDLSRVMRHIDGVYTQRFNRRHKTVGQLFAGRYKSILIDADTYLLQLVRYIHRNPVRAGIVTSMDDYPYSSHRRYLSDSPRSDWLSKTLVFGMLSAKPGGGKTAYVRFIKEDDSDEIKRFFGGKTVSPILGDDGFVKQVTERFSPWRIHREIPESRLMVPTIKQVQNAVSDTYRIERDGLLVSKRGSTNEARNVAIYLARRYCGKSLNEIGEAFGIPTDSSVSSVIDRVERRKSGDESMRKRIKMVTDRISKSKEEI